MGHVLQLYLLTVSRLPTIETIENCMKLCPMVVQAMWDNKSPLLQLPHIHEENLKWFSSKKVRFTSGTFLESILWIYCIPVV
jgi:translocation protein SEC63